MATVGEIRGWLNSLPDEAEFVVWDARQHEREVIAVAHVLDEEKNVWGKAIVCADDGRKDGFAKLFGKKARHLRVAK